MSGSDRKDSPKDQQKQPSTTATASMALMAAAPPKDAKKPLVQRSDEFTIDGQDSGGQWLPFSGRWLVKFKNGYSHEIIIFDRKEKKITFEGLLPHPKFKADREGHHGTRLHRVSDSLCSIIIAGPLDKTNEVEYTNEEYHSFNAIIFNPANPSQLTVLDLFTLFGQVSFCNRILVFPQNPNCFVVSGRQYSDFKVWIVDVAKNQGKELHIPLNEEQKKREHQDIDVTSDGKLILFSRSVEYKYPEDNKTQVTTITTQYIYDVDFTTLTGKLNTQRSDKYVSAVYPGWEGDFKISPVDSRYFCSGSSVFRADPINDRIKRIHCRKVEEKDFNEYGSAFLGWLPDGSLVHSSCKVNNAAHVCEQLYIEGGSHVRTEVIPEIVSDARLQNCVVIDPTDGSMIVNEGNNQFSVYQFESVLDYQKKRNPQKNREENLFEFFCQTIPYIPTKALMELIISYYIVPHVANTYIAPIPFQLRDDVGIITTNQLNAEYKSLRQSFLDYSQSNRVARWLWSSSAVSTGSQQAALESLRIILNRKEKGKTWSQCVAEAWSNDSLHGPLRELGKRIPALGVEIKQIESGKAASATAVTVATPSNPVTIQKKK